MGAPIYGPSNNLQVGRSYLVFGKRSSGAVALSEVVLGYGGFVIDGQCAADQSGWSVDSAGDINGDGLADLIVGAQMADGINGTDSGKREY